MKRPRTLTTINPPTCLSFFDKLPSDALLTIINYLSTEPTSVPSSCPLFVLSHVSHHARTLIASTVGPNLSFSVSDSAACFRFWLTLSAPYLTTLSLHNRPLRIAPEVRHEWSSWPGHPNLKLNSYRTLTAISHAAPQLVELDVSGLAPLRRTAVQALATLLQHVRNSLKVLTLDLGYVRVSNAAANARLYVLSKLAVVNVNAGCEKDLFHVIRSLKPCYEVACRLKELVLDACDGVPAVFRQNLDEATVLLQNLEAFELDYDHDCRNSVSSLDEDIDNLCAVAALPRLSTISFSGSGIPVRMKLVEEIRRLCQNLTDFRLIDCDMDPCVRFDENVIARYSNATLMDIGPLLTRYYPRWVTFEVDQLATLAKYCNNLTHLRLFSSPEAQELLVPVGKALRNSLVDLEVYPQRIGGKKEVTDAIVTMVQALKNLERLCLITLDLSTEQLKSVLAHCGQELKIFVFSPPILPHCDGDGVGAIVAELMLFAAVHNPNLQRWECIFQDDRVPVIKSTEIMNRLRVAVRLLESRATQLRSSNIADMTRRMTVNIESGSEKVAGQLHGGPGV